MIEERLPLDGDMSYTVVGGGIREALLHSKICWKFGKPEVKLSKPMAISSYGGFH